MPKNLLVYQIQVLETLMHTTRKGIKISLKTEHSKI